MRRVLVVVAGVMALGATSALAAHADGVEGLVGRGGSKAHTTAYKYVAQYGQGYSGVRVGHVAPFGVITVTPVGTTFPISVNDLGVADGRSVYVSVFSSDRTLFQGCLPVRATTTIIGATAHQPAYIFIGPGRPSLSCSGIATAGVATIGGLE